VSSALDPRGQTISLTLSNPGDHEVALSVTPGAYGDKLAGWTVRLKPGASASRKRSLAATAGWYDLRVTSAEGAAYQRRLAGRIENGRPGLTDPAMAGPAIMDQV